MEQFFHAVQMIGDRCVDCRIVGGQFDRAIDGQATTAVTFSAGTFYHAAKLDFDQAAGTSAGADRRIEPRDLPVAIAAEGRQRGAPMSILLVDRRAVPDRAIRGSAFGGGATSIG